MNQFYFSNVKFDLVADEPMILPEVKTSMFRGGFGHVFKKFNCANRLAKECSACLLKDTCNYTFIFADNGTQRPKPYVIYSKDTTTRFLQKGAHFSFELLLFGKATKYLPHFIFAFIELGKRGIAKSRNKFTVHTVSDNTGAILFENNKLLSAAPTTLWELPPQTKHPAVQQVSLHFITPLRLTYFGDLVVTPTFEMIIKAISRRFSALCKEYCNGLPDIDYLPLLDKAKNVRVLSNHLVWKDWSRYSSRQHSKMEFGGLVGTITFAGDLGVFLPYLEFGSVIHIGKNCVFGNGKYKILEEQL